MRVFRSLKHLLLAIKASIGAVVGVFIPTAMLARSTHAHEDPIVPTVISVMVSILLIPIVAWLPLRQTHPAVTEWFRDIFDVRTVRKIIAQIALHCLIAMILLYAAAIPLYLTKPRLLTTLFILIVPIYPTRLMLDWLYARGQSRFAQATQ